MKTIFDEPSLNPQTFYSVMPSDYLKKADHFQTSYSEEEFSLLVSNFVKMNINSVSVNTIKPFVEKIFLNFKKIEINKNLEILALHFSLLYSAALFDENKREIRMWLQYANYCLRDLIERDTGKTKSSEKKLNFNCPWDILFIEDYYFLICSEKYNFFSFKKNGMTDKYSLNLPTQIDFFHTRKISIGSYYANGGYTYDYQNKVIKFIDHVSPILLIFFHNQTTFFIDFYGKIFIISNNTRYEFFDLKTLVCRVRYIKGSLYISNWKLPFNIILFDIDQKIVSKIRVPTILTNDLIEFNNNFYLIDKQQGNVFKTDDKFNLVDKKLSFGKGLSNLIDPISIRTTENHNETNLIILNWVCSRLVSLSIF
jgi:hypothetical protein